MTSFRAYKKCLLLDPVKSKLYLKKKGLSTSCQIFGLLEHVARLESTVNRLVVGVQYDFHAYCAEIGFDRTGCRHAAVSTHEILDVILEHVIHLDPIVLA